MDFREKSFSKFIRFLTPVLVAAIVLVPVLFTPRFQVVVDKTPSCFSSSHALDTTREFVTQFPKRIFGSLEARQATGYLTEKLTAMGYEVEYVHFDGRIGGGQQAGRNVLAYKQGETDEIIAVTAHFDTARPTVQGAAKNGAAVGVLMELARVFSEENTRRSLLFAFADGGEWGSTGAKDLSLNYEKKDRIAAVLTLDYVAPGDLAGFHLDTTGQLGGLTPPGIRKLAEAVVKEQTWSIPVTRERGLKRLLVEAFKISGSDHGPFLKMGIPAINLGSYSTDREWEKSIIYSSEDTIENLKIEAIDKYGCVAEQIVRSLMSSLRSSGIFQTASVIGTVLPITIVMCIVSFLIVIGVIKNFQKILNLTQAGRELMAFFATWFPFLVLFLGIRLAYAARQFPFYDLYPAIAKDPVMQNPPWKVFAIIVVGVLFAAIAVWIIARYFLKEWTKPDYRNSCAVLCGVLAVTLFLSACYNPFWCVCFLAAPCLLWSTLPAIKIKILKSDIGKRIFDIAYIAAAAVPACLAFWWLAARLGFGWNFFWYQTLALTTGLFSPIAYFMGTAVIAVGIRFMVISRQFIRFT